MDAKATIEQVINAANLKPIERQVLELNYGLSGENLMNLKQIAEEIKKNDATYNIDKARRHLAHAMQKLRGAIMRLKINAEELRGCCTEEPYKTLCGALVGPDERYSVKVSETQE